MPSVTLEVCQTPEKWANPGRLRLGFTASKKIGKAVARNRARRRLKAAAALTFPLYALPGNDYVLVARPDTLNRPFEGVVADLAAALEAAHSRLRQAKAGDPS